MMKLAPDWSQPGTPFRHTWEGLVNIDQFRWLVRRDTQEHLKLAHDELGARHVRAVGMFDDEMRVLGLSPSSFLDKARRPRLNWQVVDYVIDSLLDMGINPMFTTSFTPGSIASGNKTCFSTQSRVSPPRNWPEWADLVRQGVSHALDRYGEAVIRQWYFEVWNEPNLSGFWDGSQADFHQLWATTYRAIKDVNPDLRVGGPSAARAEWIADLIEFGQKNDCVPDYIVAHIYNNDSESKPLSPFDGPQADLENKSPHFASGVIRGVRNLLDQMGYSGEVHWNEWGRSWWPCYAERETAGEAAWIAKTMAEVSQSGDYFAYWCLSDIYDQVGYGAETFHGNYGMLNLQGLRKPAYHAFQLLSMLGTERLTLHAEGTTALCNAIATRSDRGQQVMVYADQAVDIQVCLPPNTQSPALRLYQITPEQNNIVRLWEQMGSPAYLHRDQLRDLQSRNILCPTANPLRIEPCPDGNGVRFSLSGAGMALLDISNLRPTS